MALDPHGIGFVDLTAIPGDYDGTTKAGVKVLRIGSTSLTAGGSTSLTAGGSTSLTASGGGGQFRRQAAPTVQMVMRGLYPLSQRLYLYVNPKASDTARDFANFLATCGQSAATPYDDTVKAVQDTFRRHGYFAVPPPPPPPPPVKPVEIAAKPKPATQSTTKPTTAPAAAGPPQKVYPKDPLASPDDMVAALTFDVPLSPTERPIWPRVPEQKKKAVLARYQQQLSEYKPKDDFHGKNVSWDDLTLEKLDSANGWVTVTAVSAKGYRVTTTVSEKGNEALLSKQRGAIVQVAGTIQDYTLDLRAASGDEMSAEATETFGVLVKEAKVTAREKK